MSDQMSEVAKAAAESAKFGTKALDVAEKMSSFIARVFREPLDQASGIIGDKLKFIRWKRQVRMADEVQSILTARKVTDTNQIPLKLAIPLIEGASIEESDELQDLWNNLIANSMDPKRKTTTQMSYIDILKSLTPTDAKFLQLFHRSIPSNIAADLTKLNQFAPEKNEIIAKMGISEVDYLRSVNNLFRLRCLEPAVISGGISMGGHKVTAFKGTDQITMTILGYEMVVAISK